MVIIFSGQGRSEVVTRHALRPAQNHSDCRVALFGQPPSTLALSFDLLSVRPCPASIVQIQALSLRSLWPYRPRSSPPSFTGFVHEARDVIREEAQRNALSKITTAAVLALLAACGPAVRRPVAQQVPPQLPVVQAPPEPSFTASDLRQTADANVPLPAELHTSRDTYENHLEQRIHEVVWESRQGVSDGLREMPILFTDQLPLDPESVPQNPLMKIVPYWKGESRALALIVNDGALRAIDGAETDAWLQLFGLHIQFHVAGYWSLREFQNKAIDAITGRPSFRLKSSTTVDWLSQTRHIMLLLHEIRTHQRALDLYNQLYDPLPDRFRNPMEDYIRQGLQTYQDRLEELNQVLGGDQEDLKWLADLFSKYFEAALVVPEHASYTPRLFVMATASAFGAAHVLVFDAFGLVLPANISGPVGRIGRRRLAASA